MLLVHLLLVHLVVLLVVILIFGYHSFSVDVLFILLAVGHASFIAVAERLEAAARHILGGVRAGNSAARVSLVFLLMLGRGEALVILCVCRIMRHASVGRLRTSLTLCFKQLRRANRMQEIRVFLKAI